MIKLEPRVERSKSWSYLSPVLAILLTLITGYVVFALLGHDPLNALYTLLVAPIADWYGVTELLVMTTYFAVCLWISTVLQSLGLEYWRRRAATYWRCMRQCRSC